MTDRDEETTAESDEMEVEEETPELEALLDYLKRARAFDFSGYKRSSLARRVQRRMQMLSVTTYPDYVDYLEVHPDEFPQLFNMVLINVTGFYRDAGAWAALAQHAQRVIDAKRADEPIRLWSAGCASGEEAYTLAMMLAQLIGVDAVVRRAKIYATDLDDDALSQARLATYPPKALESLPPELVEKYFTRAGGSFVFHKELRRSVIFGRHDLMQDAPISRVDILSCRNTLMYFNAEAQGRILSRLHFALAPDGILFLGKAEMLLTHPDLFLPIDLKLRLFARAPREPRARLAVAPPEVGGVASGGVTSRWGEDRARIFETAFEAVPIGLIVIDGAGRIALINPRAAQLFSLTAHDLGRPFQDLELSYRPAELRSCIDQVRTERRAISLRDVERTGASGTAAPRSSSRAPRSWTGPLLARSRARRSRAAARPGAKYKELFDEAPDPYFVTDLHGLVLEANPRAAQLAGRDSSTNEELQTMNEELRQRGEEAHVATNGERIRWLARDVSARRHALRAVTHDRDALEARVAERTVELQRALRDKEDLLAREQALRSELEIANAAKDRFLAILSHDLRGPLNAVLGWTALLRREHLDSRTRDKALATIERNALTQAELVEALLDVSRIGAGKLQLDMRIVDLGDLARKGLDALLPAAREKGVELVDRTAHASALVVGDAARLRQVIANLLGNALAFTPGGGRIEIDLSVTADVELRIRDTGRGISEAALAFVFDCFRQNERVTPATRGLGLGLYIVRQLVEMHGGTVTAKSEGEDRGSVLTVALPRRAIEGQLPPAAESSAALPGTTEERALRLEGLRVLLVDDEADTRELLGTALTREGAILLTAADGRTALEMFGKLVPDVVVSDIGLPDMTGRALIRRIRRSGIGADVCAIAVSGFASQDDARRSLKAGFDAHVAKPFRVHELVGAITTARARRSDG